METRMVAGIVFNSGMTGVDGSPLPAVLDGGEVRRHLGQFAHAHSWAGRVTEVQTRLLKLQKGNRCTLEIAIRTESGWRYLIGKAYSRDRADVFEAMKKVWQSGLNGDAAFSIPRPIDYLAPLHLLLQEKIKGALASSVLLEGSASQRVEAAERSALWLARFQAVAPPQGKVMDIPRILRHGERRARFLVDAGMPFASKARKLLERLAIAPPALEMCAGHGDFKPEHQFLPRRGSTVTFDWDCYDIADPCRDAALFLIYLERIALNGLGALHKLESASQAFLKAYVPAFWPNAEVRLRFHKAALYLQEAKRDVGEQHLGWFERAEIMLDQGLRELEG